MSMRVTGVRRMAAGVLAAGLLVSLSGCGSDTAATNDNAGGSNAPMTLSKANFSSAMAAAQGDVQSSHFNATIKAMGQSVSMSGDVSGFGDPANISMQMRVDVAGKQVEMRLVRKVIYVRSAGLLGTGSKPWVKVDLGDAANPFSQMLKNANPADFGAYLKAVKSLKDKGLETVDGVSTHHYTLTVDTAKAMAAGHAMQGGGMSKMQGQGMSQLGVPAQIAVDAWLNGDNLPVKMTVDLGKTASIEAHFSKYGKPVSVQAPPAKQVGTFSPGSFGLGA